MGKTYKIAIFGAGAIGCFVGGLFAHMGLQPVLIGRSNILNPLKENGFALDAETRLDISRENFNISDDCASLAAADVVFVTTKATALDQVISNLRAHAPEYAIIVSLLNGLEPVRKLTAELPAHTVLAGMVPYNVIWTNDTELQQSSLGKIALTDHPLVRSICGSEPQWFDLSENLEAIQYGKLLLNLINPVNALSGLPVVKMLGDRGYRALYADAITEALRVYEALGISYANLAALPAPLTTKLLKGPDWLFNALVLSRQQLSPKTMASMAQDYIARRPTEIDIINGEIVALGRKANIPTPVNSALVHWIKSAEALGWPNPSPKEIRSGL